MDDENIGEFTEELLLMLRERCVQFSYGEFRGMKNPSLGDLYLIRGALEAAILEKQQESNSGVVIEFEQETNEDF